jgi:hypothetical protein
LLKNSSLDPEVSPEVVPLPERVGWSRAGCFSGSGPSCGAGAFLLIGQSRYRSAHRLAEQGCRSSDALSCLLLWQLNQSALVHPPDKLDESSVLEKACLGRDSGFTTAMGPPIGCARLALLRMARPESGTLTGLLDGLRKSCSGKVGIACRALALGVQKGSFTWPGVPGWTALLEQGCEHGDGPSCHAFAGQMESQGARSEPFLRKMIELQDKSCRLGLLAGCQAVARLARAYPRMVDKKTAVLSLASICLVHERYEGCVELVDRVGKETPSDDLVKEYVQWNLRECGDGALFACRMGMAMLKVPGRLQDSLQRMCKETGNLQYCVSAGVVEINLADAGKEDQFREIFRRLMPVFREGCSENIAWSCLLWGEGLALQQPVGDPAGSFRAMKKACDLGLAEGCAQVGKLYYDGLGVEVNPHLAEQHLSWACDQTNVRACTNLGTVLGHKALRTQDPDTGRRAYGVMQNACTWMKSAVACRHLSEVLWTGLPGVNRDPESSRKYQKQACDLGLQEACEGPRKPQVP